MSGHLLTYVRIAVSALLRVFIPLPWNIFCCFTGMFWLLLLKPCLPHELCCKIARIAHSLLICLLWQIPFFCCHYGRHSVCTPRLACPRLLLRAVAALINRDNRLLRVSVITITVAFCLRFMTCFTSYSLMLFCIDNCCRYVNWLSLKIFLHNY